MGLIRLALGNPVATLAGCLLAILFGSVTLTHLPIQLVPEVEQPEIVITTTWRAAAPEEVETEIIEPQEKQLRGLPGAKELLSEANMGTGKITITFQVDQELDRALIEVINRLNRVPSTRDRTSPSQTSGGGGRPSPGSYPAGRKHPMPIKRLRTLSRSVQAPERVPRRPLITAATRTKFALPSTRTRRPDWGWI